MIHIREHFMKIYDNSEFGILVRMQTYLVVLKRLDPDIHAYLENQNVKPEFYAFRWLTLLLSQEFRLPDVLRIWDSLFANQESNFEFLLYICCAMVMYVVYSHDNDTIEFILFSLQRETILNSSQAQNIQLLQVNISIDID
jgi:TBC1 domain family member 13